LKEMAENRQDLPSTEIPPPPMFTSLSMDAEDPAVEIPDVESDRPERRDRETEVDPHKHEPPVTVRFEPKDAADDTDSDDPENIVPCEAILPSTVRLLPTTHSSPILASRSIWSESDRETQP
jgi:hypothetical protein